SGPVSATSGSCRGIHGTNGSVTVRLLRGGAVNAPTMPMSRRFRKRAARARRPITTAPTGYRRKRHRRASRRAPASVGVVAVLPDPAVREPTGVIPGHIVTRIRIIGRLVDLRAVLVEQAAQIRH